MQQAFVEGMGYVALSRVRSLGTLSLTGLNQMALKVSPAALEMDAALRTGSQTAEQKFAKLNAKAEARAKEVDKPISIKAAWTDRIAELRQEFPKAYTPWAADDEAELLKLYAEGLSLKQICKILQRQPGGIRARLKIHFGDEVSFSSGSKSRSKFKKPAVA